MAEGDHTLAAITEIVDLFAASGKESVYVG
jgi:hypothetical protein